MYINRKKMARRDKDSLEPHKLPYQFFLESLGNPGWAHFEKQNGILSGEISYTKQDEPVWQIPYFNVSAFLPQLQREQPSLFGQVMNFYEVDDMKFIQNLNNLKNSKDGSADEQLFYTVIGFLKTNDYIDGDLMVPRLNLSEWQLRTVLEHDLRRHKENSVLSYFGITAKESESMSVGFLEDVVDLMRLGDLSQQESYHRAYKHSRSVVEAERNTLERRALSTISAAEKRFQITSRTTSRYSMPKP